MRTPLTGVVSMRRLPAAVLEGRNDLMPLLASGEADSTFAISSLLGAGANCYAYAGTLRDGSGLEQTGLLKEYFPVGAAYREQDGRSVRFIAAKGSAGERLAQFLARHTQLNRIVADAPQTAGLLTQLHSAYAAGGTLCLFFPLSRGESYAEHHEESLVQLTRHMLSLARAAKALHESGHLHLDIKPGNILLHPEADALQLIDFDSVVSFPVAEEARQRLTFSQGFSSPEQMTSDYAAIGVPSDLYALGAVFYHQMWERKVSEDYPNLPRMPYRVRSPLFRRMRLDTYSQLRRIMGNTLGIIPSLRWRDADTLINRLETLHALAVRDAQTGLPLYDHLCAAFALHEVSAEADRRYLQDVFADEQYTWRDTAACLRRMKEDMLYPQLWDMLRYACEALLHTKGSPMQTQGDSESDRALAARCRRELGDYLSRAYNGIGAGSLFTELYAGTGSFGERSGLEARLSIAEELKDLFLFSDAMAAVEGLERGYEPLLAAGDPLLEDHAHEAIMCLLGKQGEVLAYTRRYPEAMALMARACQHAAQLPVPGVQLLRLKTNMLRCAALCGDDAGLDDALRSWLDVLRAVTGVSSPARTPQDYAQLLAALIVLPEAHRDYQKGHLVHTVLFLLRHRLCTPQYAAPALAQIAAWVEAAPSFFDKHPGELILGCAAALAAVCGDADTVHRYVDALCEFPPSRYAFVELAICRGAAMESLRLLGEESALHREEIALSVQEKLRSLKGAQAEAFAAWFAPFLEGGGDDACLACLTFMYR